MPPHRLILKEGMIVMALRNMGGGVMNGTRAIVTCFTPTVLRVKIVTGSHSGQDAFIPRIRLLPTDAARLPFVFERRQFPIRPAFAMTISKSQGQTLDVVGIYLPKPVFSHGQLYVACSRTGDNNGLRFLIKDGKHDDGPDGTGWYTDNVVFIEVFDN
jgi:ATP-dependent DNA helicase PIF1